MKMVTYVKYDKKQNILDFLEKSEAFEKWTDDLPDGYSTKDIEMKFKYEQAKEHEQWIKKPTGEVTRVFQGDMKQFQYTPEQSKQLTKGLREEVEYFEDGSHTVVRYYDRDYE